SGRTDDKEHASIVLAVGGPGGGASSTLVETPRRRIEERPATARRRDSGLCSASMKQAKAEKVRHELLPGQSVELLKELHLVGRDGALHADSLRKLKQVNHLVQLLAPA